MCTTTLAGDDHHDADNSDDDNDCEDKDDGGLGVGVVARNMAIMMMIRKGDSCHSQGISRYIIWLNQTLGLSAEDVKDSQVKQVQRAHSRLKGPTAGLLIFYQYFPQSRSFLWFDSCKQQVNPKMLTFPSEPWK